MKKECSIAMALGLVLVAFIAGCRGYSAEKPPIHPNPNMDTQEKGKAYRASDFFDDGQVMRQPLAHTIARGHLKEDEHFFSGTVNGEPAKSLPSEIVLDYAFLNRGQAVLNRVCAACHNQEGDGNGLVGRRLIVKPTSLHSDYMYSLPPGHFHHVISEGIRTMQGYKHMLSVKDRWAVVAYIRSLQMSQDISGEWIERSASWWTQR
jgi:mono/diheme cytochrome c family protein